MSRKMTSALPLLLGNCVILFLLLAGGLFSFITAYDAQYLPYIQYELIFGCLGAACLNAALWAVPHGGWAVLGLLGVGGVYLWRRWDALLPALRLFWSIMVHDGMLYRLNRDVITEALLAVVFMAGILLGWLAVRERCWHLTMVLLTAPLLPAMMSGVLPALLPLLAQCAGWLTLLVTSLYNRQDRESLGKGVWMSLGGVSLLLFVLWAAMPQEGYTRPQWATNARDGIINTMTKCFDGFVWEGGGTGGGNGNLDMAVETPGQEEINGKIDLTQAGARRYSGDVVLTVLSHQTGRLYLRGGAAGLYTGRGWKVSTRNNMHYDPESILPAQIPAYTAGLPKEMMAVRHVREAGNAAYYPYRLLGFPDGQAILYGNANQQEDGNAVRTRQEYVIEYIPGGPSDFQPLEGEADWLETLYREYVYENYLDVPELTRQALLPLAELVETTEVNWPSELPEQFQEPAAAAVRTARALSQYAVYDLDVTAMNPMGDFVEHFLEEKRGYCVHFATTGALLLRMQGIPARYVEGYAPWVNASEFTVEQTGSGYTVSSAENAGSPVRDSDAHAWVEMYLDGYGWYPVEMTPGRQGATPDTVAPEILQTDVPDEEEEEIGEPKIEEEHPEKPEEEHPENDTVEKTKLELGWLWKPVVILLAAAAPYGAYRTAELVRRKKRASANNNQAVIRAYLHYQKLLEWSGPEEPVLEELGRKAKFSQHELTWEERENAWGWVRHAESTAWKKLSVWKRILFLAYFGGET
ncbi:MAG: transglutaminase-like domain-containing protein [Oscillospiraceae bacterium]|nr:transglutaminase-like domain-containing protein [Oscillospiraceae bacterium]